MHEHETKHKMFRISGRFRMGSKFQPFSKEIAGKDEKAAVEKVLSIFGSKHRANRRQIKVEKIEEVVHSSTSKH